MKFKIIFLFLLVFTFKGFTQNGDQQENQVNNSISSFFDALAVNNVEEMLEFTTQDVMFIEEGEMWGIDSLLFFLKEFVSIGGKRTNKYQFIKTEIEGNMAWTTYFNSAFLTLGDTQMEINWIESAVLIRDDDKWKIKLLHTTTLKTHE